MILRQAQDERALMRVPRQAQQERGFFAFHIPTPLSLSLSKARRQLSPQP